MNIQETAACLAELGHETRLNIFRFLIKSGPKNVAVGDIQKELSIPASTLSHHISRLAKVGLIEQERDGRILYCRPQFERLQMVIDSLVDNCCEGRQTCIENSNSCQ